jgi:hypothetical protein
MPYHVHMCIVVALVRATASPASLRLHTCTCSCAVVLAVALGSDSPGTLPRPPLVHTRAGGWLLLGCAGIRRFIALDGHGLTSVWHPQWGGRADAGGPTLADPKADRPLGSTGTMQIQTDVLGGIVALIMLFLMLVSPFFYERDWEGEMEERRLRASKKLEAENALGWGDDVLGSPAAANGKMDAGVYHAAVYPS